MKIALMYDKLDKFNKYWLENLGFIDIYDYYSINNGGHMTEFNKY